MDLSELNATARALVAPGKGILAADESAQQRAIEREMARIEATYGMTLDPSMFTWASDPAGS